MKTYEPPDTCLEMSRSDGLMRLFVLTTLASFVAILMLTSFGIYRVYINHVTRNAEDSSVFIADALFDQERANLVFPRPDGTYELRVDGEKFEAIDASFRHLLEHFMVVKVKLYDPSARIIYSTDRSIIGKVDKGNKRLAVALAGNTDAKLENKMKVLDLKGEEKFMVDVVETYTPVRDVLGRTIGSFEVYMDVSRYRREVGRVLGISCAILTLILSWVFLFAYLVIRRGTKRLKKTQELLRLMAVTDPLTGLYNRRYLMDRCKEEFARLRRGRGKVSCPGTLGFVMIDIDYFKRINDTYGHAAGDEVIRELASRLKMHVRQHDIIGRYGGEEFLVVLLDSDPGYLHSVAERIRNAAWSTPVCFEGKEIAFTVSVGGSGALADEEDFPSAIKRADDALYCAKEEGRNRVAFN